MMKSLTDTLASLKDYADSAFLKRQPRELCAAAYTHLLATTEALTNLLGICEQADFKNGVSAGVGHPDEGEHWASVYIDAARAALEMAARTDGSNG
jgi:hypothetical protein